MNAPAAEIAAEEPAHEEVPTAEAAAEEVAVKPARLGRIHSIVDLDDDGTTARSNAERNFRFSAELDHFDVRWRDGPYRHDQPDDGADRSIMSGISRMVVSITYSSLNDLSSESSSR